LKVLKRVFAILIFLFSKTYRIDDDLSENKTADFNVTQKVKGIKVNCIPEWDDGSQVLISHITYTTNNVFQYKSYEIFLNETCKTNVFIEVYGERLLTGGSHISNVTLTCADDAIENFVIVITSAIVLLLVILIYFISPAFQAGRPVNRV